MLKATNSLLQLATIAKKQKREDTALHYSGIKKIQVQNHPLMGLAGELQGGSCLKNSSCTANMAQPWL